MKKRVWGGGRTAGVGSISVASGVHLGGRGPGEESVAAVSDLQARKLLIVEGKTDKQRLQLVLQEPVDFICTNGTLSYNELESLIGLLQDRDDVYILVDADVSGMRLRSQLRQELPNAKHLYTRRMYREVATTPVDVLAWVLSQAHFLVKEHLLLPHKSIGQGVQRSTDKRRVED